MANLTIGPKIRKDLHLHDKKLKTLETIATSIREDIINMLVEAGSGHRKLGVSSIHKDSLRGLNSWARDRGAIQESDLEVVGCPRFEPEVKDR